MIIAYVSRGLEMFRATRLKSNSNDSPCRTTRDNCCLEGPSPGSGFLPSEELFPPGLHFIIASWQIADQSVNLYYYLRRMARESGIGATGRKSRGDLVAAAIVDLSSTKSAGLLFWLHLREIWLMGRHSSGGRHKRGHSALHHFALNSKCARRSPIWSHGTFVCVLATRFNF
jgi:hypothetical protein